MMAGERETIKSGFFRGGSAPVKIMHTGFYRENEGQSKKIEERKKVSSSQLFGLLQCNSSYLLYHSIFYSFKKNRYFICLRTCEQEQRIH